MNAPQRNIPLQCFHRWWCPPSRERGHLCRRVGMHASFLSLMASLRTLMVLLFMISIKKNTAGIVAEYQTVEVELCCQFNLHSYKWSASRAPKVSSSHSLTGGSSTTMCWWFSRGCGNWLETLLMELNFGVYLSPSGGRHSAMVSSGSIGIGLLSCKDGLMVMMAVAIRMCLPLKAPAL